MNKLITTKRTMPEQPDLFARFLAYLDVKPKSVSTYTRALRQLARYYSDNNITMPRREDIIAYREYLKASGHKPSTVQNYITAAKIMYAWAEQEGLYPDIAEHVKGAQVDREHKKDYLTSSQVKEILSGIDTNSGAGLRDYAIIALMVTGGLRTIEVSRANVEDLRSLGNMTVLYVQGKGRDEKTDYVKISAPVESAIRAYLAARKAKDDEPLFTSTSNNSKGLRLSTRSISGIVKERMRAAGYDSSRLTAHSLRHTAVTLSLLAGKDITEVQEFARHSNISTTMIYNHSLDKALNGCADAITASISWEYTEQYTQ